MRLTGIVIAAGLALALAGFAKPAAAANVGVHVQTPGFSFHYGGYPYYGGYPHYGYPAYRYRHRPYYGYYYERPRYRRYRRDRYRNPRRGDRCAHWSRRCAANWGYGSSNYYGCLRYYHCR